MRRGLTVGLLKAVLAPFDAHKKASASQTTIGSNPAGSVQALTAVALAGVLADGPPTARIKWLLTFSSLVTFTIRLEWLGLPHSREKPMLQVNRRKSKDSSQERDCGRSVPDTASALQVKEDQPTGHGLDSHRPLPQSIIRRGLIQGLRFQGFARRCWSSSRP